MKNWGYRMWELPDFSLSLVPGLSTFLHQISNIIRRRGSVSATAGPIGMEELTARSVYPFILVCTEVITLRLQQVSRESCASETIEIAQS